MKKFLAKLKKSEAGATAIEYGLIAALVAVAAITGLSAVSSSLNATFNSVSSAMDGASN
ncbi:Flp family type IVb pilin [Luteithermobacter gelatinilyticus]|uniref:Flp family type IVb pilin n=1 Tax=Luteithermobacter gelatinilyticus TaxID=2582913 RepID=UPI0011068D3B|nr:Flp family type IVb pilin [Luteithermobacter gelatinilyticus]